MADYPLPEAQAEVHEETHHTEVPLSRTSSKSLHLAFTAREFLPMDSNDLVTVQVDQVLFRVSADILRLCRAIKEPTSSPLIMSGITAAQLRSFLTVATAKTIQCQFSPSIGDWVLALHAAMQLGCGAIGAHAINSINQYVAACQPVPLIQLGLTYQVKSWARNGFTRLIEREEHLSSEEGTKLGMDLVSAIYRSRETLARSQNGGKRTATATELIDKEPGLKDPRFTKLAPIEFQAPANALSATEDSLHYQTSLVDLLVDDRVWRVTMATLGSTPYFLKRANQSDNPIQGKFFVIDLSGEVDRAELESYLSLVNARRFKHSSGESLGLSFQQWVSALRLATIFGHHEARRFAISFLDRRLRDQDPFDVIDAAKTCNVDQWLESQYARIAERSKFPSEEEGRRLGVTSLLAVCKLREEAAYRSGQGPGFGQLIQAASKAKSGRP